MFLFLAMPGAGAFWYKTGRYTTGIKPVTSHLITALLVLMLMLSSEWTLDAGRWTRQEPEIFDLGRPLFQLLLLHF
jgi:hypothetical protein